MNPRCRHLLLLLALPMTLVARAQDSLLTLDEALARALESNFDIRVARNVRERAANYDNAGQAGMLPRVDLNGAYAKTTGSARQELSSGAELERDNSVSDNLALQGLATWTVFDGLRMFATREKLRELSAQGEQDLKIRIEASTVDVITAYFEVVQQQQLLRSLDRQIAVGEEVVNISDRKLTNGSGSRLELLLARTDLNALRSEQLTTQALLDRAKVLLCNYIAMEPTTAYMVEDTVVISYDPSLEELKRNSSQQNSLLLRYDRAQRISELGLKESRAARSPVIDLTGSYQFSRATSNASFILLNRNLGATFGVTATVPLFNGFRIDTDIKNAKLELDNARIQYEQIAYQVNAVVVAGHAQFQAAKGVMALEEENIAAAREVLAIARERFRVGASNIIELKDAQATYGQAVRRLAFARNAAKLAETELRRLAGVLVR